MFVCDMMDLFLLNDEYEQVHNALNDTTEIYIWLLSMFDDVCEVDLDC